MTLSLPARAAAAALLTLPLVACADTRTIREHGFPAFEEVVGATTPLERADERQVEGRDLVSADAADGPHKIFMTITPLGTDGEVLLEVRAVAQEVSASPVAAIAVSAHPMKYAGVTAYRRGGELPGADAPLHVQSSTEATEEGVVKLLFRMPRASIPPGTERLAMPILVRYADGWVYVRFYETGIPAAVPMLDEQGAPREGAPPGGGEGARPPGTPATAPGDGAPTPPADGAAPPPAEAPADAPR